MHSKYFSLASKSVTLHRVHATHSKRLFSPPKGKKVSAGTYHLVNWGRHRPLFQIQREKWPYTFQQKMWYMSVGVEHWLSELCFIPYCPCALKTIPLGSWTSFTQLISKEHWGRSGSTLPHGRLFSFSQSSVAVGTSLILGMVWCCL